MRWVTSAVLGDRNSVLFDRPATVVDTIDPVTGKHILVKDGRFGMYVTDGETNATLRRGDTLEALDLVRAQELLAGRRAWEAENFGN